MRKNDFVVVNADRTTLSTLIGEESTGPSRRRLVVLIAFYSLQLLGIEAWTQETSWEAAPYHIRVWLQTAHGHVLDGWSGDLERHLGETLARSVGAAWKLEIQRAPEVLAASLFLGERDRPDSAANAIEFVNQHPDLEKLDKLVILNTVEQVTHVSIQARELDVSTRRWGMLHESAVRQPDRLGDECAQLVVSSVTRIGKVGRVKGDRAELRIRAGLLATPQDSWSVPERNAVYFVRLRQNDRFGRPFPDGIEDLQWTALQIVDVGNAIGQCKVISALRSPLRIRSPRQTDRYAWEVQPTSRTTRLQLSTNTESNDGLEGYGVYVRTPSNEELRWCGVTDWDGTLDLPFDLQEKLQIFYVKNGQRLLARIPIVVGAQSFAHVRLPDDDPRLEAEGFLRGMQERVIEVSARTRILALRIRRKLQANDRKEIDQLLEQIRELDTRDDFLRTLQERKQAFSSADPRVQSRIDQLFANTQQLLLQQLDTSIIDQVRQEIAASR